MDAPMDGWMMDGREEGREARRMRKRGKRQKRRESQSAEKTVSSSDRQGSLELGQRKARYWGQDGGRRGLGVGDTEGFPQTSCDLSATPDLSQSILQAPRGLGG